MAKAIAVDPSDDAGAGTEVAATHPSALDPTQAAAWEAARDRMRATRVRIADDRVGDGFTLGRQAFEKISPVEGIRLSRTMKRDLMDARADGRSAEEARTVLAAKYGRRRP